MRARTGSAFLLCLALSAFAVMVGYAFLRGMVRNEMSGRNEQLIALAKDAAQSGLAHATEQILLDYNAGALQIGTSTGLGMITSAPTHLDGPYRAPFVSLIAPNRLRGAVESDDVAQENHLLANLMMKGELLYPSWHDAGCMIYDARGRYIEVNYHNTTRPAPMAPNPEPVAAVRFLDPTPVAPERSKGLFLDEDLHRLTGGTPEDQRRRARYRVRYAVGVEDLSGHLLANPRASMNVDRTDPNNDYRAVPRWIDHAAYVFDNMVSTWSGYRATALRMGHIFRGRGNSNNADRAWVNGPRNGLPATFPMMFRQVEYADVPWYGYHCAGGKWGPWPNMGGRLYSFNNTSRPNYENIAANPSGGEILTPIWQWGNKSYVHALIGPQYSWFNQIFALQGALIPEQLPTFSVDGFQASDPQWSQAWSQLNTIYSLFGRSQVASDDPPGNWTWYQGRVNTPWQINLLTATPQVTSEMILAYLPPHLKTLHYTHDEYYQKTGVNAQGSDVFSPVETLLKRNTNGGVGWNYAIPGLEVINDQVGNGFSEFPAPSSLHTDGTTVIKPDYYQNPPDPRPIGQRYPGPLCRGNSANGNEGSDDLGKDIDVDNAMGVGMQIGWCTHTYNPLLYFGGSDRSRVEDDAWGTRWYIVRRIDTGLTTYKFSYFWDLAYALTTTLSYARAVWVQYPNTVFDPSDASALKGFDNPALRDPLAYDTIEEIDALFLRQMGENFVSPGTPAPANPFISNRLSASIEHLRFSVSPRPVSNTIRSLVTNGLITTASGVSSLERGKVMERMLNDFRMSFFGSSPKYADFRPMDFDGDGNVQCSCYDVNPLATPSEVTYRTARWKPVDGGGRGPAPTPFATFDPALGPNPWFTVSGCFFIGKSHFYRIFTRGEVYDSFLKKPVAQQDLESVMVVDPEAPQFPAAGRISPEQRTIFKQWRYNDSVSEMPLQMR